MTSFDGRLRTGFPSGTVMEQPSSHRLSAAGTAAAKLVHLVAWKGKVFDPGTGTLRNKVGPLGTRAITAKVYHGQSWYDTNQAIILDYSRTSWLARWVRDEIREVSPGVFLGIVYWGKHRILKFVLDFTRSNPPALRSFLMKSPRNVSPVPSQARPEAADGSVAADRSGAAPATPGTSASPYRNTPAWRVFDALALRLDRRRGWYRLPKPLGLLTLAGIRNTLRRGNLFDTTNQPQENPSQPLPYSPSVLTERTADGSWNDLDQPAMGMANTRFGRNVPIDSTRPEPPDRMLEPNPRVVSRRLMTRDQMIPAAGGNALIAAWLQFMIRDWFNHGSGSGENPWVLPTRSRRRLAGAAAGRAPYPCRSHCSERLSPAAHLPECDVPLVGRLANLRHQQGRAGLPQVRARRKTPNRERPATAPRRSCREPCPEARILAGPGHDADPVRTRAQCHLRPARRRVPRLER